MFCTECGQPMADEAKFCAYCGTRRIVSPTGAEAVAGPEPSASPQIVPPPAPPRAVRPAAEITPIRPAQRPVPPPPVVEPPAMGPDDLSHVEEAVPWQYNQPEPVAAPPAYVETQPASDARAPQAPPPPAYRSVPFAADAAALDAGERRRKTSPVLIGAIIVALIAIVGVIWMVRSSMSFGGKAQTTVGITIYPTSAKVAPGKSVDFVADVTGAPSSDVTWSLEEGDNAGEVKTRGASAKADTISLYSTYTAPKTPGTYHLVATSTADTTKSATAEITVTGK